MSETAQHGGRLAAGHVGYDVEEARAKFARTAFTLEHDLADNPLFDLEALAELAARLPDDAMERNGGNREVVVAQEALPVVSMAPPDFVLSLPDNPGFITLPTSVPGVDPQPGYEELFQEILEGLAPIVPGGRDAMHDLHGVVFVTSGGNKTPVHIDPEPSFLLHVRGSKRFSIGRHPDAEAEQHVLERFYAHDGYHVPVVPVDVTSFDLTPGTAVHVPPVQPHWVENGPELAISFSVGFQTAADHRRRGVYQFNRRVRRLGLTPRPHGADDLRDRVKGGIMGAAFEARRRLLRRPR